MGGLCIVTARYIWCLRGAYFNMALWGDILFDMCIPPLICPFGDLAVVITRDIPFLLYKPQRKMS